jgi:ketosteroid isomerase-like protein
MELQLPALVWRRLDMTATLGDEDAVREIAKVRDAWTAAVKAKDVERLIGMLTDDIVMMHPNRPAVIGLAANRADLLAAFGKFHVDQIVVSDEMVVAGEWAFDRSRATTTLTPVVGGAPVTVRSKAITILRHQADGSWKIARVIGNLDHPA